MSDFLDAETSLAGLFALSFLAATLLPGGSEIALYAFVKGHPDRVADALVLATVGNTLGGMTSYACGRFLPKWQQLERVPHMDLVRRYGSASLLLAWAPLIGDLLCVAAGWLRTHWLAAISFMAVGKGARYWLLAQGAAAL
ncbi:MAG TPA: YqaA family protein [Rhodocyclaceae bacterium]